MSREWQLFLGGVAIGILVTSLVWYIVAEVRWRR